MATPELETYRLTVKNLPQKKDETLLKRLLLELFTQVAPVYKVSLNKIGQSKDTFRSCYVDFVYEESIEYAANALDGTRLFGSVLQYDFEKKKSEAKSSTSNGHNHGGSHSKSSTSNSNSNTTSSRTSRNPSRQDDQVMEIESGEEVSDHEAQEMELDDDSHRQSSSKSSSSSRYARSRSIGEIINIDAEKDQEQDRAAQNAWQKNSRLSKSSGHLNKPQQNQSTSKYSANQAVTPLFNSPRYASNKGRRRGRRTSGKPE